MVNSQEILDNSKTLKCRFTLLKLRDQCAIMSAEEFSRDINNWLQWHDLKKELGNLLDHYDNDGKLNEEFLLSLYNIKLINNPILIKRLIKLIKIV